MSEGLGPRPIKPWSRDTQFGQLSCLNFSSNHCAICAASLVLFSFGALEHAEAALCCCRGWGNLSDGLYARSCNGGGDTCGEGLSNAPLKAAEGCWRLLKTLMPLPQNFSVSFSDFLRPRECLQMSGLQLRVLLRRTWNLRRTGP